MEQKLQVSDTKMMNIYLLYLFFLFWFALKKCKRVSYQNVKGYRNPNSYFVFKWYRLKEVTHTTDFDGCKFSFQRENSNSLF